MHPEIAKTLVAQRRDELVQDSASRHRAGRPGSSLVIIISAHRSA